MPLDITFTLSDQDLDHFQAIVDKAKSAMEESPSGEAIEAAAKQLIADAKDGDLPDFIGDRLAKLETIINFTIQMFGRTTDFCLRLPADASLLVSKALPLAPQPSYTNHPKQKNLGSGPIRCHLTDLL